MVYRSRRKKKSGDGDGVMRGEADGRSMRRRYALYAAFCLIFVVALIFFGVAGKGGDSNGSSFTLTLPASFEFDSHSYISLIDSNVQIIRHGKTGMPVLTIVPDDVTQDATFGYNVRTIPNNDHGTAHVIEHGLFDGSKHYPVSDVMNQLLRGSLQTHLDTYTAKDRTVFAMSSRNRVDFRNNMKVMLDAIINPNFLQEENRWVFRQEAWRVEMNKKQELILTGNAINEAKAAKMHPNQIMMDAIYEYLFPDTSYRFNARGETSQIVNMNYEEMKEFYEKFYHPSNAQAFCFGPADFVSDCLEEIDSAIAGFDMDEEARLASVVKWQELGTVANTKESVNFSSFSEEGDHRAIISWVLNDSFMDGKTEAAWFLIEELLIGSNSGWITKEVMDNSMGSNVIGGLEHTLQQWTFTIAVTGVPTEADINGVVDVVRKKLAAILEEEIDGDAVLAAASKLDYRFRDVTSSHQPRGVSIWHKIVDKWTYDQDPRLGLNDVGRFEQLKEELTKGPKIITDLIRKHLVKNKQSVVLHMNPSTTVSADQVKEEQNFLNNLQGTLSKEEGLALLRESEELREIQTAGDSEEDLAKIPRLRVADLEKKEYEYPIKVDENVWDSGLTVLEHQLPSTKGLAYVDFAVDISHFDLNDVVFLPALSRMMLELGTDRVSNLELQREIDKETGGIWIWPLIEEIVSTSSDGGYVVPDGTHMVSKLVLSSSTLAATESLGMFSIYRQVLFETNFNQPEPVTRILREMVAEMENDIQVHGEKYTELRIKSKYSLPGFVAEQWKGVTQLLNLRRILYEAEHDFDTLNAKLTDLRDQLRSGHRNGMLMSVTGDKQALKDFSPAVQTFVKQYLPDPSGTTPFPDFKTANHPWVTKGKTLMEQANKKNNLNEAFIIPARVNSVGEGGELFDVGEKIDGSDLVVTKYIGGHYLYNKVRTVLGAMDAYASLDMDSGVLLYQSKRDPNIVETLDVYKAGASFIWNEVHDESQLPVEAVAAIVAAIGEIDGSAPQPKDIGYDSMMQYLKNESPATRQKWRDQILGTSKDSFMAMVERLGSWGHTSISVVGGQRAFDKAVGEGLNITACDYTGYTCHPDE